MGNENKGDAVALEPLHDAEQRLALVLRQGGGRLIHNNQLRVIGQRLADFNHLHFCSAHAPQRIRGAKEGDLKAVQQLLRLPDQLLAIDDSGLADLRLTPDKNVFSHAHVWHKAQLLKDHGDALSQCLMDRQRGWLKVFSVEPDRSGVCAMRADQDLHQCRFPGAVFSHQCVQRSLPDLQINMMQNLYTGKAFADVIHL